MEKQSYPLLTLGTSFDLHIPKKVENKIRNLCNRFSNTEWSGVLFYKVSGSFEKQDFKATCLDIQLMDIGQSTYTEFFDTPDIISYRIEHPELLKSGVYEALIHSHQSFSTFFSSTDLDTLREEGNTVNHFLSLIVNNAGTYTARITRRVKKITNSAIKTKSYNTFSYNSYENKKITIKDKKAHIETEEKQTTDYYIESYNLNIIKEEIETVVDLPEIDKRIQEIKETKERKREEAKPVNSNPIIYVNKQLFLDTSFKEDKDWEELVDITIVRLLTSSWFVSTIDIYSLITNPTDAAYKRLDKKYEDSFGDLESDRFFTFIYDIITAYTNYIYDAYFALHDQESYNLFIEDVISKMTKLPKSIIKEHIIEVLENLFYYLKS